MPKPRGAKHPHPHNQPVHKIGSTPVRAWACVWKTTCSHSSALSVAKKLSATALASPTSTFKQCPRKRIRAQAMERVGLGLLGHSFSYPCIQHGSHASIRSLILRWKIVGGVPSFPGDWRAIPPGDLSAIGPARLAAKTADRFAIKRTRPVCYPHRAANPGGRKFPCPHKHIGPPPGWSDQSC